MLPQCNRAKKKNMTMSIDAEKAFSNTQPTPFMLKINKQNGNVWPYVYTSSKKLVSLSSRELLDA